MSRLVLRNTEPPPRRFPEQIEIAGERHQREGFMLLAALGPHTRFQIHSIAGRFAALSAAAARYDHRVKLSIRVLAGAVFAAAAVLPALHAAAPPEWPRFRGPLGNPVATGRIPDTWSKTQNIEWTAEVPGRGWSSPIVAGDRIFVTAAVTDGASKKPQIGTQYSNEYVAELQKQGLSNKEIEARVMERDFEMPDQVSLHYMLYCLDLKSGTLNWKQEYNAGHPPEGRHRKNSFASETPVTDGTLVYVYATNLGLWAYDMKGRLAWKTPLEVNPMYGDFGAGASPVLAGNLLVIVHDNEKQQFIAAFDKKTGKEVWRTNRDLRASAAPSARRTGWSTPFVWTTPGRTEIVTIGPGFAVSYDLAGKELWRLPGMGGQPIPSPYVWDGVLYLNGGAGGAMAAVKPGATGTLAPGPDGSPHESVAWSVERAGTYLATQLAYQGALYLDHRHRYSESLRRGHRQAQLPGPHRRRHGIHRVAMGVGWTGLRPQRGRQDLRARHGRQVRAAARERSGRVRAGHARARERPVAPADRGAPLLHPSAVRLRCTLFGCACVPSLRSKASRAR